MGKIDDKEFLGNSPMIHSTQMRTMVLEYLPTRLGDFAGKCGYIFDTWSIWGMLQVGCAKENIVYCDVPHIDSECVNPKYTLMNISTSTIAIHRYVPLLKTAQVTLLMNIYINYTNTKRNSSGI